MAGGLAHDLHALGVGEGLGGGGVVRMQAAGEDRLLAAGDPLAIITASAQAVEPSYIEALATSMPVSAATWVWNSNSTCSVPWAISGW